MPNILSRIPVMSNYKCLCWSYLDPNSFLSPTAYFTAGILQRWSCKIWIFSFYILLFLSRKSLAWTREVGSMNSHGTNWLSSPFAKDIENWLSLVLGLCVPWWTSLHSPGVHGIVLRQHAFCRSIISFWKKSGSLCSHHAVSCLLVHIAFQIFCSPH